MSSNTISISTETILRIILILLLLGFVFWVRDVLALFFIAVIHSFALLIYAPPLCHKFRIKMLINTDIWINFLQVRTVKAKMVCFLGLSGFPKQFSAWESTG